MINELSTHPIGSWETLTGNKPNRALVDGLDFRLKENRREVFINFYRFHLKNKSHPGAVYFMLDFLKEEFSLNEEDMFWLAFINGVTQNIVTTWVLFKQFPSHKSSSESMQKYIYDNWPKLGWDMDRRYVKSKFGLALASYQRLVCDSQSDYFSNICVTDNSEKNFRLLWDVVIDKFKFFGRLSTFSYLEYLKIIGLNIDCDSLFLDDMSGSKSHRNGLCVVLGRDDLDWHKTINPKFMGYRSAHIDWLIEEGKLLLEECREKFKGESFIEDVSYFTLESTLCCYKSWHRPNRRYPNVYMDMFHDRIKAAETSWGKEKDFSLLWAARKRCLPENLLLEYTQSDPGLSKAKQNHYLETGEVIMMDQEYSYFKNSFNKNTTLENFFA